MGKGSAQFRVTQIHSIPLVAGTEEQVKHAESLREWEKPERDFEVKCAIKNWILKARIRFHLSAAQLPMPLLSYRLKGNTLGQAWYQEHKICINPIYLTHSAHQILNDTIPHEVCHLVTGILHNWRTIRPHGQEWQRVCFDLGHYPSVKNCNVPAFKEAEKQVSNQLNQMSADDF